MRIAVIGAGVAGLAALRHSLDQGHDCTSFEQTDNIGGTWNYTDQTGVDDNGLPVHSSMYQGLMTNLPKELMEFQDFPYEEKGKSFIEQPDVLEYIKRFAKEFDLHRHIKFRRRVLQIDPTEDEKWYLTEQDLKSGEITEYIFDAVLVCVGNYSVPKLPNIPGVENFQGRSIHSHNYRKPDDYKGKKVLIIGAGPSGADISRIICEVTETVFLSFEGTSFAKVGQNVIRKPLVTKLEKDKALFSDGSEEIIDCIIYCTGYKYSYPFLTNKCGITIENNWVKYLYKHVVNIEHPTMGFIGIPFKVCPFPLVGLQVRFFLALLKGDITISKQAMLEDTLNEMSRKREMQWPEHYAHKLGMFQREYFDDLAETGQITKLKPVISALYEHIVQGIRDFNKRYRITSDEEFEEF